METRTLKKTLVSNENLLEEVKKVRSPEQIRFLYDIIVLMRSHEVFGTSPSVSSVTRRRRLDFTSLPKVDVKQSLQEVMNDLRGDR
ncbi:hypothetical protein AGMMS49965_21270 [Bacteroidia bacterium]|nr:hypothetical protein AGMMS49965_21270 [Bacteroidia bacterium]